MYYISSCEKSLFSLPLHAWFFSVRPGREVLKGDIKLSIGQSSAPMSAEFLLSSAAVNKWPPLGVVVLLLQPLCFQASCGSRIDAKKQWKISYVMHSMITSGANVLQNFLLFFALIWFALIILFLFISEFAEKGRVPDRKIWVRLHKGPQRCRLCQCQQRFRYVKEIKFHIVQLWNFLQ